MRIRARLGAQRGVQAAANPGEFTFPSDDVNELERGGDERERHSRVRTRGEGEGEDEAFAALRRHEGDWGADARLVGQREAAEVGLDRGLGEVLRELELAVGLQEIGRDVGELCVEK